MRLSRRDEDLFNEINIVPFTDICLVLLIIFMITANFIATGTGMSIQLPRATTAVPQDASQLTVFITAEGQVYLNSRPVTANQLAGLLRQQAARTPKLVVAVSADRKVPYEKVVTVLDAVRIAGIEYLALAAQPPRAGGER